MSENIEPTPDLSDTQPRKALPKKRNILGLLIAVGVILLALALGSAIGYGQGIAARVSAQKTNERQSLAEQYALAEKAMSEKRYAVAQLHIKFIIEKDQSYPGAVDLLTRLMVEMAITPSPTPTLVPSATPTPDLRSQDTIFAAAQDYLKNKDWTSALNSLDSLRKADPTYKTAQVDAMYFKGLRNRGVDEILYAQRTNLEGGIYDLTLAERFGPLDGLADGTRTWARYYILGASFWEIDWAQAVTYFQQVAENAPNLRDASNVTAAKRYYDALLNYGDFQVANGARQKDRCLALNSWGTAQSISGLDATYTDKFNALNLKCNPPTETPAPEQPTPTTGP